MYATNSLHYNISLQYLFLKVHQHVIDKQHCGYTYS